MKTSTHFCLDRAPSTDRQIGKRNGKVTGDNLSSVKLIRNWGDMNPRRQREAKEKKRRAEQSPSKLSDGEELQDSHGDTLRTRPMSAKAEERLQRERESQDRPRSAKNQDIEHVKADHVMKQAQQTAQREGSSGRTSRPTSAEGLAPKTASSGLTRADQDLRTSQSGRPSSSASTRPPGTASTKREASRGQSQGGARASVSGSRSRSRKGGRKKSTEDAGVDSAVLKAMREELEAVRALEESGRQRIRDKDEQLHELRQERLTLTQNLSDAQDRYLKIYEEVERAREANARFEDVKKMLQLSEEERVRLIERVEELTEETTSWRPLKNKMDGRIQQLEQETEAQQAEIERLKTLEDQLRNEKERNVANQIQIQSWQDISSELQGKCDRWEQVKDSLEVTLKAVQSDMLKLRLERDKLEKTKRTYYDMLVDLNIDVPEEDDHGDELGEEDDELDIDAEVDPLTTLRTMSLLKGQLPEVGVPQQDTEATGVSELAEVPPYGSANDAAPQIFRVQ